MSGDIVSKSSNRTNDSSTTSLDAQSTNLYVKRRYAGEVCVGLALGPK